MTSTGLRLNSEEFRDIFPFHVAFGRDLRLAQVGRSWARLLPDVVPGASLSSLFTITRPGTRLDFDTLRSHSGALFVMECTPLAMSLRGQLRLASDGQHLLFLASPWVTDLKELKRFNLTLTDFPAHEPVSDYLFLLQTQRRALTDASQLAIDLQQREGTLRAVLDTAADGIVTIDTHGIVRSFNTAAASIFGYQSAEVVGRTVSMLMPAPAQRVHDGYLSSFLETGDARIIGSRREVTGIRKDGSAVELELAVSEVVHGRERLLTGILRDLTERKRDAAALQAIEERLVQALSASGAGSWSWNFVDAHYFLSNETYRIYGVTVGTVVTRDLFYSLVLPEDREHVHATFATAREGHGAVDDEFRIVRTDGAGRWVRIVGRIGCDPDGLAVRMSGIIYDVTQAHREQDLLRETEERLQQTLEAMRAGAWHYDLNTGNGFWSDENYRLLGLEPGAVEPSNESFFACLHPDDRARIMASMQAAIDGTGPLENEYRVVWPDGTVRWMHGTLVVVRDASGAPLRVTGISMDVTARRDVEEEARATREPISTKPRGR